ncbi:bacteriohemerythrin [Pseudothauera nasutitermitis]|uniref:Bacteriohemerythrin n=1 Tax=Pseudothauera nasutitermitis TaxID=2565930 RepID=A0A4S4AXB9_9RHOO|nr:bacteriohemerythrin [Pseudothauera nasutitermitis]THF64694.1 bacteriohemerythrin [Pseudothauera nasutitermitis]
MAIAWTIDLDTGIAVIDQQHRRIVDYINRLEGAQQTLDRTAVGKVLDELVDYTLSHFIFEESLMEEAGYPFVKAHKRVHELFVRRVNEYLQRFRAGEDVAGDIHRLLSTWLISHIRHEDADYVSLLKPEEMQNAAGDDAKEGWLARSLTRLFR